MASEMTSISCATSDTCHALVKRHDKRVKIILLQGKQISSHLGDRYSMLTIKFVMANIKRSERRLPPQSEIHV